MARIIGGKLLEVCPDCARIIRLDKPLFGSLHICTTSEERSKFSREIALNVAAAERLLEKAQ